MDVKVYQDILSANDRLAALNRARFKENGILALNLIGSPGCGKTTLLEATLKRLVAAGLRCGVIEGDLETSRDAERIAACGVPAVQINTRGGCHLDAASVQGALAGLSLSDLDVLFIENVGNLVCPAGFDLGEAAKVVLLSVTEGEDKPSKYPTIFRNSGAAVVTKTDLLPHTDFNLDAAVRDMKAVNEGLKIFTLSVRAGIGLEEWIDWLLKRAGRRPRD
jgi:hydrogenase nickel incorporation protein HypB